MSSVFSNFDLAGTVRNLGPSTQDGQLPTSYIVGGTVRLPILSFYSQAEFSSHRGMDTRFGLEYRNDRFWVGGGYQTLTGDLNQSIAHFPLGGGIRVKDYSFDYTWTPGGELGDQHRIGLKMAFGQSDAQKRDLARQVDQQMEARMKQHADTLYEEADAALLTGRLEEAQKKTFAEPALESATKRIACTAEAGREQTGVEKIRRRKRAAQSVKRRCRLSGTRFGKKE
jgi:hypothetical protein